MWLHWLFESGLGAAGLPAVDFQQMYSSYNSKVRAIVHRYGFHDGAADDLVQDVFIQVWKNLATLRSPGAVKGWICTITRNACLSEIRKHKPHLSVNHFDEYSGGTADGKRRFEVVLMAEDGDADFNWESSLELIDEILSTHTAEPRATIARMFYRENRSVKEIADELDLKQNTILSHLRRFRLIVGQALVSLMEEQEVT